MAEEKVEMVLDLMEDLTFERGLGWRDTSGEPTAFGINRWKTKGGIPVMVPDQWFEVQPIEMEPLPQEFIRSGRYVKIGIPEKMPGADNMATNDGALTDFEDRNS